MLRKTNLSELPDGSKMWQVRTTVGLDDLLDRLDKMLSCLEHIVYLLGPGENQEGQECLEKK